MLQFIEPESSAFIRPPDGLIKELQSLLNDVYKDSGDGRTLLRELIQNADDAKASRILFVLVKQGWEQATSSLLHGPALVVLNDGTFSEQDHTGMRMTIGGSKAAAPDKIGRFGIGLKSLFHLCEAIVYLGADQDLGRYYTGVLNPWAGVTGTPGDAHFPDWDRVTNADATRLKTFADCLSGSFERGLLLWLPLRQKEHLKRLKSKPGGLRDEPISAEQVLQWFTTPETLVLNLAQCANLAHCEAQTWPSPNQHRGETCVEVQRTSLDGGSWTSRITSDTPCPSRPFQGTLTAPSHGYAPHRHWKVYGLEAIGHEALVALRTSRDWPIDRDFQREEEIPRKALAHAAITLICPSGVESISGVCLRWCVFLPLDDEPLRGTSSGGLLKEFEVRATGTPVEVLLHGYFWPTQDRKAIPGVVESGQKVDDLRSTWNVGLRDQLLLPLLPQVLAPLLNDLEPKTARQLMEDLSKIPLVKASLDAICRSHWLLPCIQTQKIQWRSLEYPVSGRVLALEDWVNAPDTIQRLFPKFEAMTADAIFIDRKLERLGARALSAWIRSDFEALLNALDEQVSSDTPTLKWLHMCLHANMNVDLTAPLRTWLCRCVAKGELGLDHLPRDPEAREARREAWRKLGKLLPEGMVLYTQTGTAPALKDLQLPSSEDSVWYVLLPIVTHPEIEQDGHVHSPKKDWMKSVLKALAAKNGEGSGSTKRRDSSLLLVEALLKAAGPEVNPAYLMEVLGDLPLLRVRSHEGNKYEGWTLAQLEQQARDYRVFRLTDRSQEQEDPSERVSDPPTDSSLSELNRQIRTVHPAFPAEAVGELSKALGVNLWRISIELARCLKHLPLEEPTPQSFSKAIEKAPSVSPRIEERSPLCARLGAERLSGSPEWNEVPRALYRLLSGRTRGVPPAPLYHDDSNGENGLKSGALAVLKHRSEDWRLLADMPSEFTMKLTKSIPIESLTDEMLLSLCEQTERLNEVSPAEIRGLLQPLHRSEPERKRRWKALPLHRTHSGSREPLKEGALRQGQASSFPMESALLAHLQILNPDEELKDLYQDIPPLDGITRLELLLRQEKPWEHADDILRELEVHEREHKALDPVRQSVLERPWLPLQQPDLGLAPNQLLLLPASMRRVLKEDWQPHRFPTARLPTVLKTRFWKQAEATVTKLRFPEQHAPTHRAVSQVREFTTVLKRTDIRKQIGATPALRLGVSGTALNWELLKCVLALEALESVPTSDERHGWPIVLAAAKALQLTPDSKDSDATNMLCDLASALEGPVAAKAALNLLDTLATARPKEHHSLSRLYEGALSLAIKSPDFQADLPLLTLPAQDGQWYKAATLARAPFGVASKHRLRQELQNLFLAGEPLTTPEESTVPINERHSGARILNYFKRWHGKVQDDAVAAFLFVLTPKHEFEQALHEWKREDVATDALRSALLDDTRSDEEREPTIFVQRTLHTGKYVEALNVVGNSVQFEADEKNRSLFAKDMEKHSGGWQISLRQLDVDSLTPEDLAEYLGDATQRILKTVFKVQRSDFGTQWRKLTTGSQTSIVAAKASIVAGLPMVLNQLEIQGEPDLLEALRAAERAQRLREQNDSPENRDKERKALSTLLSMVEGTHEAAVRRQVQEKMKMFGYEPSSVPLELLQNADDALVQREALERQPLSDALRTVSISIRSERAGKILELVHYGRPINEHGGAAYPQGRERRWDEDLYYMHLLNLSGKRSHQGTGEAGQTTGRFGLGFKSVHLISDKPSVVSGFLKFSIHAGLLPKEDSFLNPPPKVEGRLPTCIRLPLRDPKAEESILERLRPACALLPIFGRKLLTLELRSGAFSGTWSGRYRRLDVPTCKGEWRLAEKDSVLLGQTFRWLWLSLPGGEVLMVALKNGLPERLPETVPFLWATFPTQELWHCGYAVNGPWKLDPGRTHVSLEHEDTLAAARRLGEALGEGLLHLHDALHTSTPADLFKMPVQCTSEAFRRALWEVLIQGCETTDVRRQKFFRALHGFSESTRRGLSLWAHERAAVPTDLSGPFASVLKPLKDIPSVRQVDWCLADNHVQAAIANMETLPSALSEALLSSRRLNELSALAQLSEDSRSQSPVSSRWNLRDDNQFRFSQFLQKLRGEWKVLNRSHILALRALASGTSEDQLRDQWSTAGTAPFESQSQDGRSRPLNQLLLSPEHPQQVKRDEELIEEWLKSACAPETFRLPDDFVTEEADLRVLRRLRGAYVHTTDALAHWATQSATPEPFLEYLLRGKLRDDLLAKLRKARPVWLQNFADLKVLLAGRGEAGEWLLMRLFPERYVQRPALESAQDSYPSSRTQQELENIVRWWDDVAIRKRVLAKHEQDSWPSFLGLGTDLADGLSDEDPETHRPYWLALLLLGACRSIGQTRPSQHRGFLEFLSERGWWERFGSTANLADWMLILREWQDMSIDKLDYSRWMQLFPLLFQLSRYWKVYRRLILTHRTQAVEVSRLLALLAPRTDGELSGYGAQFDAPPLPLRMGLHWVLRELVRLNVLRTPEVCRLCWMPSHELLETLTSKLGMPIIESDVEPQQKAQYVHTFVIQNLPGAVDKLRYCFDIPVLAYFREKENAASRELE